MAAGAVLVALVALGARLAAGTRPSGERGAPGCGWCRPVPAGLSRHPSQPRAQRSEPRGSGTPAAPQPWGARGAAGTERGRGGAVGSGEGPLRSVTAPSPRSVFPVERYS